MEKLLLIGKMALLTSLFSVSFLALSTPICAGDWVIVHGHSGHIEHESRVESDRVYTGWGLDFVQSAGLSNWVHYSIPVTRSTTGRYIGLHFKTGSIDAKVTKVHVFNGRWRIKEYDVSWSGDWQAHRLDLETNITFDMGLGISIKVEAGFELMDHTFIFSAVAAYLN